MLVAEIGAGATVVSLLVSLAALAIAAASLWHSALKPAEIGFDHLPTERDVHGGGTNDVPNVYSHTLTFAVTNEGARAGLLESLEIESIAVGATEMAQGIQGPRYEASTGPAVLENGESVALPRTVEAGDVRSFQVRFEVAGAFLSAAWTQTLDPPDRTPLAELLRDIERMEFTLRWRYRRRAVTQRREVAEGSTSFSIPGSTYRTKAAALWEPQNKKVLLGVMRSSERSG